MNTLKVQSFNTIRGMDKLKRIRIEIYASGRDSSVFDESITPNTTIKRMFSDVLDKYDEKLSQLESLSFNVRVIVHAVWDNGYQVLEADNYKSAKDLLPTLTLYANLI